MSASHAVLQGRVRTGALVNNRARDPESYFFLRLHLLTMGSCLPCGVGSLLSLCVFWGVERRSSGSAAST